MVQSQLETAGTKQIAVTKRVLPRSWDVPYLDVQGEIVGIEKRVFGIQVYLLFEEHENLPWKIWKTDYKNIQLLEPEPVERTMGVLQVIHALSTEIRAYEELITICKKIQKDPKKEEEILSNFGISQKDFLESTTKEAEKFIASPKPFTKRQLEIRELKEGETFRTWQLHWDTVLPPPTNQTESPKTSLSK